MSLLNQAFRPMGVSAFLAAATLAMSWPAIVRYIRSQKMTRRLAQLPKTLASWRRPGRAEDEVVFWGSLAPMLRRMGYTLWPHSAEMPDGQYLPDEGDVFPNGYLFATSSRGIESDSFIATVAALREMWMNNSLSRVVRTPEGYDNIVRVVSIGSDGREQLRIWRFLATAPQVLLAENHTLPLLQEIDLGPITLGLFPRVSQSLEDVYTKYYQNSVGDVLAMILQALEGLAFIHDLGIAHRDAVKNNFVVQYYPESLRMRTVSLHTPRVYLIDFETAIQFPEGCPVDERVCTGFPLGGSVADVHTYGRPVIPEMRTGEPYNPFKLDVWQLGNSFIDFDSTLPPVKEIVDSMAHMDPEMRLTADEALSRLRAYVESVPPKSLLIPATKLSI